MRDETQTAAKGLRELVAFRTAGQDFCIDIMSVREIRGWSHATLLPHTPDYVCGVINLRGSVVPIVDLSARLALGKLEPSERNVIIIVLIGQQVIGILVEAVFDILSVDEADLQATPEVASAQARAIIKGIFTDDERTLRLIDLPALFPEAEYAA